MARGWATVLPLPVGLLCAKANAGSKHIPINSLSFIFLPFPSLSYRFIKFRTYGTKFPFFYKGLTLWGCLLVSSGNERATFTHPVFASLDHPLFACGGKRVNCIIPLLTCTGLGY